MMPQRLFEIATKVAKPLSLASAAVIFLYLLYTQMLEMPIFGTMGEENTFQTINTLSRFIFFFAVLAFVLSIAAWAYGRYMTQKLLTHPRVVQITGNVYDSKKLPVAGATVYVDGIDRRKTTDSTGWFTIEVYRQESWRVHAVLDNTSAAQEVFSKHIDEPIRVMLKIGDGTSIPDEIANQLPNQEDVQVQIESLLKEAAVIDHDKLFGADERLKQLQALLSARDGSWIISLFGAGGIGKTALAYESVKRFAADSKFTRVAWVSAKQRYFSTSDGYQTIQDAQLQWADLIRQMANQLNIELGYSRTLWLENFRNGMRSLPLGEKCLIVIDNLETIEDLSVIRFFHDPTNPSDQLIDPHKILVTTRKSIIKQSPKVDELTVNGLSPRSAYQFIRDLGKTNRAICVATDDELNPIFTITDGNPLLIKLIVRRFLYTRKSIPLILQELRELSTSGIAKDLKDYLYVQSLKELETRVGKKAVKQIMNAFCPRPAGDQISYKELKKYSGISDAEKFETTRCMACNLSLIRASDSTIESKYSIHSLLWEFTCRNI